MPELIADRTNGLLARSGDAESFAQAIEELVEARALRERLGAAARRTVEQRLTDIEVARRISDVYGRTLAGIPQRAASDSPRTADGASRGKVSATGKHWR